MGSPMFADTRFGRDQVQDSKKGEKKRPRHAKPLGENVIMTFEKLVECAETPQLWCAADLFALLAHTSHRGLDGVRSRSMQVTESAVFGEESNKGFGYMDSMSNPSVWTQR